MKIIAKSSHQDCGPYYLLLLIFFLYIHSPLLLENNHCFPQQIRTQITVQWYILKDYSSVRIDFNMIKKQHTLPIVYTNVAKSGWSSDIANHLGVLVGQNRCRFLKMTEHN